MRKATILFKDEPAGTLTQHDDGGFTFAYHSSWLNDASKPPICLTLPKNRGEFHSKHLFPFFFHMLPEGNNKSVVCRTLKIDPDDPFGILTAVAKDDTIGAVRVVAETPVV
jgi:HipA-like protein